MTKQEGDCLEVIQFECFQSALWRVQICNSVVDGIDSNESDLNFFAFPNGIVVVRNGILERMFSLLPAISGGLRDIRFEDSSG